MKKTKLWSLLAIVLVTLMPVCLTSCGDDDEEQPTNATGGTDDNTPTQAKSLTSIYSEDGESYLTMAYDSQGRVTRIGSEWDGDRYEISYNPVVIQEYETYSEDNWQHTYTYAATTDNQGRVTKVVATGIPYGNGKPVDFVETYTYNSDGYLIQSDRTWKDGKDYDTFRYSWTDGNLTTVSWTQVSLLQWYEGEIMHEGYTTDYGKAVTTYGSQLCTDRPITFGLWYAYAGFTLEPFSGLFGKPCRNLPSQVTFSGYTVYPEGFPEESRWDEEDEEDDVTTFNYILNADGTVARETYKGEYDGEVDENTLLYTYGKDSNGATKSHKNSPKQLSRRGKTLRTMSNGISKELQLSSTIRRTMKRIAVGE